MQRFDCTPLCSLDHCTQVCNDLEVQIESARERATNDTRNRILEVALEVLGQNPDAGMADIAASAGVVRRTVYGHFATRADLVGSLTERAVREMTGVLADASASNDAADVAWTDFIARLWPVVRRYRVLLALRRGGYGEQIHRLLGPLDDVLADFVRRGQAGGAFGKHLPAGLLSQVAYAAVFSVADHDMSHGNLDATAATVTSLLLLGVPEARAKALVTRTAE